MKRFAAMLMCLVLLAALVGCTSQGGSSANEETAADDSAQPAPESAPQEDDEKVTVRFTWEGVDDNMMFAWEKFLLEPFAEQFPNIDLKFEPTPDQMQVIKVQLAAGEGPDVYMSEPMDIGEYAKAGMALDLTEYREHFGWDDIIFDWALDTCEVDGTLYALPHAYEGTVFWYNKEMFEEHGWTVPTNRAEFEAFCDAALEAGIIPISSGSAGFLPADQYIIGDYLSTYGPVENYRKLMRGDLKFQDPEIRGAFELLVEDWNRGWYNEKQSHAISQDDAGSLFLQGRAAANWQGTWMPMIYDVSNLDFTLACVPWPAMSDNGEATMPIGVGNIIVINANSKVKDEAAEVLNFFYSDAQRVADSVANGLQTLCLDIDVDMYHGLDDVNILMLDVMNEAVSADKVGYVVWSFMENETNNYMYENISSVYTGDLSLDDWLDRSQELLDAALANGWRPAIGDE